MGQRNKRWHRGKNKMKTRFTGKFTETGKKIMESETEQKDCDEINAMANKIGLDKFPDYKPSTPSKSEFLFG